MNEREITTAMTRVHCANDPWSELMLWLKGRSALNQSMGGEEATFISLIVMWVAQINLPTGRQDRKAAARVKVTVANHGRADFDVNYDDEGNVLVVIKPRIRSEVIAFSDGSVCSEWGPEDGSNIQRRVETQAGVLLNADSDKDWSTCDAARWVAFDWPDWTKVHEPEPHGPDGFLVRLDDLLERHRRMSRVEGVLLHE
jgi:hypothetical protein